MTVLLAVGFVAVADDSSATESFELSAKGDDYVAVGKTLTYVLTYDIDTSLPFKAELLDSDGNAVGKVSPASDSLSPSQTSETFEVTAPDTAGDCYLRVTVTKPAETEGGEETTFVRTAYLKAVDPIVLSVTVENKGDAQRTFTACFYIQDGDDWIRLDDSEQQNITVNAGATRTITYNYVVKDVENTTFCLQAEGAALGGDIVGLGPDHAHTFYKDANDYKVIEYVCIAVLVILLIVAIWIFRKPIKNRGKPKARR